MAWHMQKMFNIAAGVVGAILGGWLGASWTMTQSVVYHMGDFARAFCQSFSGFTPDQFGKADSARPDSSFATRRSR